jgi:serine/threonine protein kinase
MTSPHDRPPTPRVPKDLPQDPGTSHRPTGTPQPADAFGQTVIPPSSGIRSDLRNEDLIRRHQAYVLKRQVGRGAFGEVWEAIQVTLERTVAIKRLREEHIESKDPSSPSSIHELAFHREALIAGQLDHPNIVPVYDLGADEQGRPLLAMKLVTGMAWDESLAKDLALGHQERLQKHIPILAQVVRAVAFAHARGVVHRDLKPSQVMLGEYGEVYLMDWGLAVASDPTADTDEGLRPVTVATPLPQASNPAGTVAYMAPEQTDPDTKRIGPWTDVYLLGGILYNILTGTCPHPQPSSMDAFLHAARGLVEPASVRTPDRLIPEELESLCNWALHPTPSERPQSAGAFLDSLQAYLTGATSREDSRIFGEQAQALWDSLPDSPAYEELEQCDRLLTDALTKWPGNDPARQLQQQVLVRYTRSALQQSDFALAGALLSRIESPDAAGELRTRLIGEQARAVRLARIRKVAIVASFSLLFIITVLGVAYTRFLALNRIQQAELKSKLQQRELDAQREQDRLSKQQRERDRSSRISRYRSLVRALEQETVPRVPMPNMWRDTADYSHGKLTVEKELTVGLRRDLAELESLRKALDTDQYSLEPEPFPILLVRGILALHDAVGTTETAKAHEYFRLATVAAPWQYEGHLGMAMASARSGQRERALREMEAVLAGIGRVDGSVYDAAVELAQWLSLDLWAGYPLRPADVVVDSANGGQNHEFFSRKGNWQVSDSQHADRSRARGLTADSKLDSVLMNYFTPLLRYNSSGSGQAHFAVPPRAQGTRWVYVTWPRLASASVVHYTVQHSGGVTSVALVQDGHGLQGPSNGDLWTPLGEFRFTGAANEGVFVDAGDDAAPLESQSHGRVYVDAALYAAQPLDVGIAPPRPADPEPWPINLSTYDAATTPPESIPWILDMAAGMQEGAQRKKPLVVFAYYPISSSLVHPIGMGRDYWQNRIWTNPAIRRALNSDFVPVSINLKEHPMVARDLDIPSAAVSVVVMNSRGARIWHLSGKELLISPMRFLTGLVRVRDGLPVRQ